MKDLFKSHSTKCKQVESVYFNFTQMQSDGKRIFKFKLNIYLVTLFFFSKITDIHLIKMN